MIKIQCNLQSCRSLFLSNSCRLLFKLETCQLFQMDFDGKGNENSSPPLDFDDFPQETNIQNEPQFFFDMENRMQKLFTELQMYRSGAYEAKRFENETNKYKEQILEMEQIIENTRREGQRAAAAAERMVIERDAAVKKLAVVEPALEALVKEREVLEERAKEMFYSIEAIKQDESNARIRLEANEAARNNAETQLNNLKQLLEELQSNQSRLEEDLQLMTNEIEASKHLQSIWKNIDEQRQQQLQDVLSKLEVAIEKHAVVSVQLEEDRTKASIEDRMIKNDPYKLQREDELMQLVNEERAGADSLREALQTASAAQARLLALHSSSNFAKQHSNISME